MARTLAACAAVAAGALPLVVATPAPFVDWPNHIARVFIGAALLRGDPGWSRLYTLNPVPVPNAALDLGIGALTTAGVGIDVAAAVFLVFSYAVFVSGVCRLARSFDALDASKPVLASLLFLTGPLMFGLVNYMLGLGCASWVAGIWLDAPARRRWAIAVIATAALFYVHLLAAGVWVMLAGCADLAALRGGRRTIGRCGSSLAALGVFLGLLLLSPAGADSIPRADASNVWYPGHGGVLATVVWKGGIFVRLFTDHASIMGALASLAGLVAFVALARRPRLGQAALAVAAALVLALVLPESAGTGSLLDYRLALVPLIVGGAAATWRAGRLPRAAFAVLIALSLARTADFAVGFAREAAPMRAVEAAAARLPSGTVLLTARGRTDEDIGPWAWWAPPMEHAGTRAVLAGVFVPTVFAVASQQPVVLRPAFAQWRHEWRIATSDEVAAMLRDIRPLCDAVVESAPDDPMRHVALFEAYPGKAAAAAFPASRILLDTPAFRLIDPCETPLRPS